MAAEDLSAKGTKGTQCPDLAALLHAIHEGGQSETFVSTHVEECERCQETLSSALLDAGIVAHMRRGNPLGAFADEPELAVFLSRFAGRMLSDDTLTFAPERIDSRPIVVPREIGGYEIVEYLDRGGMGAVYRAHQASLNRDVALKMMLPFVDHPQALRRFHAEGQAIARLQHPHIVQIFELGEHEGLPYLCMELLEGGDLDRRLRTETIPPREAAELTALLADAIEYSHGKGILHRDLKPSNVLFSTEGVPKVGDFGLAKMLDDQDRELTQEDTVLGTPSYMAPEQARGAIAEIGPATDVYGLGALLYRILTGHPPFKGENKLDTLAQVRHQAPVAPSQHHPRLCPDLESICLKCLAKSPRQRYPSARELAEDLRRWLAGEMPVARRERRSRRLKNVAVTMVVLLLMIGTGVTARAVYLARYGPEARRERLAMRLQGDAPHVLVGATGLPDWYSLTGEANVGESLRQGHDQTVTARSRGVTFVVLADDPQHEDYRLSAEIRHDLAGRADCGAGLFVCLREHPFGAEHMQLGCLLRFNDLRDARLNMALIQAFRPGVQVPQVSGNRLRFVSHLVLACPGMAEPEEAMMTGRDLRFEPAYDGKRWRSLEIEVHPDQLLARWEDDPPLTVTFSEMQQNIRSRLPSWYRKYQVAPPPTLPTIDVRGKLGIYVRNSSVSFRNVRIEPLTNASVP